MKKAAAGPAGLRRVFAVLLLAQGIGLVLAALMLHTVNVPISQLRIETPLVLGAGAVLLALGLAALAVRKLPLAWIMAAVFATLPVSLVFALGYHPVRPGDFSQLLGIRSWQSATEWTESNSTEDPVTGWKGKPNTTARQSNRDFQVTYHTDPDGWRVLRTNASDAAAHVPTVWFVGCSFTFGAGVEDTEVYAYQLAARAWPHAHVRNFSYSGWGTTNAYLILKDKLARTEKPDVAVYGLISHHTRRNYLRQSWFGVSNATSIPHFELEDGQLRWKGFMNGRNASLPDSPELDHMEFDLTVALIRGMAAMSKQHGVPFVLLVLHNDNDALIDAVRDEPNLHVLDVSKLSSSFHPHDGHPTAVWHQAVARGIAGDRLLASLTGITALHAPEAIPDPPMQRWQLASHADLEGKSSAKVIYPALAGAPLRVEITGAPVDDPWKLYLQRRGFDIAEGRRYVYEMRVRASAPRVLQYLLGRSGPPWGNLGLEKRIELGTEWRTLREEFNATGTDRNAQLMLLLGGAVPAVEVGGEPVLRLYTAAEEATEQLREADTKAQRE